jgi:predicted dehydrogenase
MGTPSPDWNTKHFKKPISLPLVGEPVPGEVNWDLWLGPAAERGYHSVLHPRSWRGFYEFGTGLFGDWFCHIGDGAVWVLDLYEPTAVECIERGPSLEGMMPDYSIVRFDFPARGAKQACSMYWYDGSLNGGTPIKSPEDWSWGKVPDKGSFWYGDKSNAYLDERSNNPRFSIKERMREYKESGGVPEKYTRVKGGPHREWVNAIKGDIAECGSNFDYAAPMTEVALIGVLAQRFGGRIEWDPKKGVTNRPELNAFVQEPVRPGWEAGQNIWV